MTLYTFLFGRILPTAIAVAAFCALQSVSDALYSHAFGRINAIVVLGVVMIWCPSVGYYFHGEGNSIVDSAIRCLGWLFVLVYGVVVAVVVVGFDGN